MAGLFLEMMVHDRRSLTHWRRFPRLLKSGFSFIARKLGKKAMTNDGLGKVVLSTEVAAYGHPIEGLDGDIFGFGTANGAGYRFPIQ